MLGKVFQRFVIIVERDTGAYVAFNKAPARLILSANQCWEEVVNIFEFNKTPWSRQDCTKHVCLLVQFYPSSFQPQVNDPFFGYLHTLPFHYLGIVPMKVLRSPFVTVCFSLWLETNPCPKFSFHTLNSRQPILYYFNWMFENLYMGNDCLTKHPSKNWLFRVPGMFLLRRKFFDSTMPQTCNFCAKLGNDFQTCFFTSHYPHCLFQIYFSNDLKPWWCPWYFANGSSTRM